MEFLPFGLAWGATSLIDFMSVALALGMVLCLDVYLRSGAIWSLVLGSVTAWTAMLVKVTTGAPWLIMLVVLGVVHFRAAPTSVRRWIAFVAAGPATGLVLTAAWTQYADAVKMESVHTQFLASSALRDWNFGTLAERLDPFANAVLGDRFIEQMWPTPVGLAIALLPCLVSRRGRRVQAWALMAVVLLAVSIFFNLYVVHEYYFIAIFPATCALLAIGVCELSGLRIAKRARLGLVGAIGTVALVLLSLVGKTGAGELRQFAQPTEPPALAVSLNHATAPSENVLVVGCDWDPMTLYFADRKGLMVRVDDPRLYPTADTIRDYPVVVTCGPDPNRYLPTGYAATPTPWTYIYRVIPTTR
jgi:hypothetical protein